MKKGLNQAKLVFNNTKDLQKVDEMDYYKDNLFIKRKSRKKIGADYIEQRCSNGRVTIGNYW